MADGDHHVFAGDEVFHVHVGDFAGDFGPAVVAVFFLHLEDVFADDVQDEGFAGQDGFVSFDLLDDGAVFIDEFFHFQADELNELQSADRLGLCLAE